MTLGACASKPEPTPAWALVRGTVSFADNGEARVAECGTDRTFILGQMANGPYMRFQDRYRRLSEAGEKPVFVEVTGNPERTRDTTVLERPSVLAIKPGPCR